MRLGENLELTLGCVFELGEGGRDEGESWVSGGVGWKREGEKKTVDMKESEGVVIKAFLVSEYTLEIRETVYETSIDFMLRQCHTIISKLIEQGFVMGIGEFDFRLHSLRTALNARVFLVDSEKMSRDVITVGSTMRIPLLYRGEYSQRRERFMNYLEEQTDGEAMINSIQNGDQPLHVIAQVSLAGNAQNAPLTLKDPKQMRGSEYGEQDRKAAILYKYETFKANEGEKLLDTYLRYLQVINDLKKCGYKKDNYELNYKFLNNLQPEWKQYGTLMRQTKNLMDINIDALYNILKQNQGDVNDALGYKKKGVLVTSDLLALVAEKTNITALLAKAFNRRKFYSKPTNNNLRTSSNSQSANKKQDFVKTDDKKVEKKADEKKRSMSKVKCYNCKKEGHFVKDCKKAKVKDYNYYKTKMLLAKKDSDE
nr:hypothetical protein [Tanacetum cinerariifolium]